MKDYIIRELSKTYQLAPVDMGELADIKKGLTNFHCETYQIENIGNLFFIEMKAVFGLMKMDTAVITPVRKDLSFCNFDAVHAMGNDTFMFEMYRTCIKETDLSAFDTIKEKYRDSADYQAQPRWYDSWRLSAYLAKKEKGKSEEQEQMMKDCLSFYLDLLSKASDCDPGAKTEKNRAYAERLLSEGGAAVDSMKKMIGEEKTSRLIREFMYAV